MTLVLFIYSLRAGGAERVLTKLADFLVARGHRVLLITQTGVDSDAYPTRAERLSLQAGATSSGNLHALFNNIRRLQRLFCLLRRIRPHCMLAFMPTAAVVALLAARPLKIPVIAAERSHPEHGNLSPWRQRLQRWLYPHAFSVTVQTEAVAEWYRDHQGLSNLQVIPNGITLPLPAGTPILTPSEYIPAQRPVILSVGRLDSGKNTAAVLRAFAAAELTPAWQLVVIGDGDQADAVQRLAEELEIDDQFILLRRVGNIQDWYERASIYVSASLFEGFPNVLLEAMACGCPCIAYDCPTGPADIIEHDQDGLLIPLGDEAKLALAIQQLAANESMRQQFGERARHICERFDEPALFDQWAALLEQAGGAG